MGEQTWTRRGRPNTRLVNGESVCHALLRAVLVRAIGDALGCVPDFNTRPWRERTLANARAWIRAEGDEPWTFRWICDEMELDARKLRRGIERAIRKRDRMRGMKWQYGTRAMERLLCNGS